MTSQKLEFRMRSRELGYALDEVRNVLATTHHTAVIKYENSPLSI